ncbi:MAG: PilZ domain-containing protein [Gammaproteobacteria bacterium]|nr:PilZ domain-containing protein [Gammaproteobacteria bacterium]
MSDEKSSAERRNFTRIFFDAETVVTQGEHIWPVELIDISLRGVLVKNPGDMALDKSQPAEVSIHLTGALVISMQVRVKHVEGDLFGMLCEHIDLDSMIHLRRLVELNTGDNSLLERELSALG